MEEIIGQYGKIIVTIVAIIALVAVVTYLVMGNSNDGSNSLVHNLFANLLEQFAGKTGLTGIDGN